MVPIFNIIVPKDYVKLANDMLTVFTTIFIAYIAFQSMSSAECIQDRLDELLLYIIIGFLYNELFMKYMLQFK